MNLLIDIFFMAAMFALGAGWQYTNLRSKYHRGCGDFLGSCAQLILSDDFDARNVAIAFHTHMPWQGHLDPDLLDRMQ